MTVGSLFSGIGGLDLGFERAGCKTIWVCEKDKHCKKLLADKFPRAKQYSDVKHLVTDFDPEYSTIDVPTVPDIIVGGDPCPAHSNATHSNKSANQESSHPDLSGYFLAVVGRFTPKWVVRENVPSPVTIDWFATALGALGYTTITVWINASEFVSQNRLRAFVVGCTSKSAIKKFCKEFSSKETRFESMECRQVTPCLTTAQRRSIFDTYCFELGRGIRVLEPEETEFFAGFPHNWTSGFSSAVRNRMHGNAVVPQVAEAIAVRIVKASRNIKWEPLDVQAGIERTLGKFFF